MELLLKVHSPVGSSSTRVQNRLCPRDRHHITVGKPYTHSEPSSEEVIFGASELKKKKSWFYLLASGHVVYEVRYRRNQRHQAPRWQSLWKGKHGSMSHHPAQLAIVNTMWMAWFDSTHKQEYNQHGDIRTCSCDSSPQFCLAAWMLKPESTDLNSMDCVSYKNTPSKVTLQMIPTSIPPVLDSRKWKFHSCLL